MINGSRPVSAPIVSLAPAAAQAIADTHRRLQLRAELAQARPDLAERFLRIERETGFTFRHKKSLADILKPMGEDARWSR
jgi:hypothetical protein